MNVDKIKDVIVKIATMDIEYEMKDVNDPYFPYPKSRPGQYEAFIDLWNKFKKCYDDLTKVESNEEKIDIMKKYGCVRLIGRTGSGKTAIFMGFLAKVISSLETKSDILCIDRGVIITIRNRLQEDIYKKYEKFLANRFNIEIVYLEGKEKECNRIFDRCACSNNRIYVDGVPYMITSKGFEPIPCEGCMYYEKKLRIKEPNVVAVLNHGNFRYAQTLSNPVIVIDEADMTLESILENLALSKESRIGDTRIRKIFNECFSDFKKLSSDEIRESLYEFLSELSIRIEEAIEEIYNDLSHFSGSEKIERRRLSIIRALNKKLHNYAVMREKVNLYLSLIENTRIPFSVIVSGNNISITPVVMDKYLEDIAVTVFPNASFIILASASIDEKGNVVSLKSIPFKSKVIFVPIGNLSRYNTEKKGNKHLIIDATSKALEIAEYIKDLLGIKKGKFVIHTANTDFHGKIAYKVLKEKGKYVVQHTRGKYKEALDKFLEDENVEWLVVSACERGEDLKGVFAQFIIKVPYDSFQISERKAYAKILGKEFSNWYNERALKRIIQMAGRNSRSPDEFAITVIFDSKFENLLSSEVGEKIPDWFVESMMLDNDFLIIDGGESNVQGSDEGGNERSGKNKT